MSIYTAMMAGMGAPPDIVETIQLGTAALPTMVTPIKGMTITMADLLPVGEAETLHAAEGEAAEEEGTDASLILPANDLPAPDATTDLQCYNKRDHSTITYSACSEGLVFSPLFERPLTTVSISGGSSP